MRNFFFPLALLIIALVVLKTFDFSKNNLNKTDKISSETIAYVSSELNRPLEKATSRGQITLSSYPLPQNEHKIAITTYGVSKGKQESGMFYVPEQTTAINYPGPRFTGWGYARSHVSEGGSIITTFEDRRLMPEEQADKYQFVLHGFYMDHHPVTNLDYLKFVEATNARRPLHWKDGKIPDGEENLFVVNVSHTEAVAYADWVGKRLPLESEYLRAKTGNPHFRQGVDVNEWTDTIKNLDAPNREYIVIGGEPMRPAAFNDHTGFRCVLDEAEK